MIGIYKFTNKLNNKVYIGKSVNVESRIKRHLCNFKNENNQCYFYRAIRKYGIENFEYEIICECKKENLNEMEKYYIHLYVSNNLKYGYNMTEGGDGALGRHCTEENRKKLSKRMKENNPMKNGMSDEQKKKISQSLKGRKMSKEFCEKTSKRMKENNPMKNKETAKKVSEKQKGKIMSKEAREKISAANNGKVLSEETKRKISESCKNRKRNNKGQFIKK